MRKKPKFHVGFQAWMENELLSVMKKYGGSITIENAYLALKEEMDLHPAELNARLPSHENKSRNTVRQASRTLLSKGIIERSTVRGVWTLTKEGKR